MHIQKTGFLTLDIGKTPSYKYAFSWFENLEAIMFKDSELKVK